MKTYSLVIKHRGRWYKHMTDPSMAEIRREIEWLNNTEYPPTHVYVVETPADEPENVDLSYTY